MGKTSWDDNYEVEFEFEGRPFKLKFHASGYYDSGRINYNDGDYPPEGDNEVTEMVLNIGLPPDFSGADVLEGSRDWQRLMKVQGLREAIDKAIDKVVGK